MAKHGFQIDQVLGRQDDWTPIAVAIDERSHPAERLLERSRARRWRWHNLSPTSGALPAGLNPRGALVSYLPTDPTVVGLLERGIPTVRLGTWPHPDDHRVPVVMPAHADAGRLGAEHFAERDFKHVAYVGRQPWSDARQTYEAFAARAAELGCRCHLLRENVEHFKARARSADEALSLRCAAFADWLAEQPAPLGLMTFGDPAAALYCQWALDAGRRVPEELAVIGVGNRTVVCESAAVPLSSVAFDDDALADAALDTLEQLMAGRPVDPPRVMVPPARVVTRQSTDVLAASDPHVVRALRYMWDHVTEDLSVDQIAEHVGTSRRTLEKAFKRDLGRGINKEFQRRRLEKAKLLLAQTDLPVGDVAEALSFSSAREFCRVFRVAFGLTPGQHRRRSASAD